MELRSCRLRRAEESWSWSWEGAEDPAQWQALTCQSGYVNLLFVLLPLPRQKDHFSAYASVHIDMWAAPSTIRPSSIRGSNIQHPSLPICVSGDLTILFIRRRTHFQCTLVSSDKPAGSNNYYRINNRLPVRVLTGSGIKSTIATHDTCGTWAMSHAATVSPSWGAAVATQPNQFVCGCFSDNLNPKLAVKWMFIACHMVGGGG